MSKVIDKTNGAATCVSPHETRDLSTVTYAEMVAAAEIFGIQVTIPHTHPFVGRFVICRCSGAGVHAGELVSQRGDCAVLKNSRRIWQWTAVAGVALSGLSQHGLKEGKVDTLLPDLALTGVIETIPCSEAARRSILGAK